MELKSPKTLHGMRLYHCPELLAFITPQQCTANRAEREEADDGDELSRSEAVQALCLSCPGVAALWERQEKQQQAARH